MKVKGCIDQNQTPDEIYKTLNKVMIGGQFTRDYLSI